MQSRLQVFILFLLLGFALEAQELDIVGGEIRYGESQLPDALDPVTSVQNMANVRLVELVFESLLDEDEFGDLVPKLAAGMPGVDGVSVLFDLREDVLWHDQVPFTSEDVKYTFDLIRHPDTVCDPYLKKLLNNFIECTTDGPTRVIFTMRQALKSPEYLFTFKIVPKHAIGANFLQKSNSFVREPIGTGPFQFLLQNNNAVRLQVSENHYLGRAYLDGLKMEYIADPQTLLNSLIYGGLDAVVQVRNRDITQLESSGSFNIRQYNSLSFSYIGFNFDHPVLSNRKVRLAITVGIDRKQILKVHYFGKGQLISGPYPPASPYNNPEVRPYRFDPNLSKQFLKEAGCIDSDGDGILELDGIPLVFELLIEAEGHNSEQVEGAGKSIQDYLRFIGMDLKIRHMDSQSILTTVFRDRQFDMIVSGWVFDAANDVSSLFHSRGYNNYLNYENADVDRLVEAISASTDPDEKRLLNYSLHEKLFVESPYTFLWTLDKYAAINTKVRGSEDIHPFKFFTFVRNWYIPIDER